MPLLIEQKNITHIIRSLVDLILADWLSSLGYLQFILLSKTILFIYFSSISNFSIPDVGYSRKASCALSYISTSWLVKHPCICGIRIVLAVITFSTTMKNKVMFQQTNRRFHDYCINYRQNRNKKNLSNRHPI